MSVYTNIFMHFVLLHSLNNSCWTKSNDGAIFAFIGPIASIILVWFYWHYTCNFDMHVMLHLRRLILRS